MEGEPIPFEPDMQEFQVLEYELTEWVRELRTAARNQSSEELRNGEISQEMYRAINRFHLEGGHVTQLDEEHIRDIQQRGVIAMIELNTRDDVYKTVGTVSALSRSVKSEGSGFPTSVEELDPMWPQYDLRDISGRSNDRRLNMLRNCHKRLLIVRSSIRSSLSQVDPETFGQDSEDDLSLRRLGLAALGKDVIFRIAKAMGSETVTFNIGSIGVPEQENLNIANMPSIAHNSWMEPLYYRMHYADRLAGRLKMYFKAYDGTLDAGLDEFEWEHGILRGKRWPLSSIHQTADHWCEVLKREIAKSNHAPW